MSLANGPKVFTISFGEDGEMLLAPKGAAELTVVLDLLFSSIGLKPGLDVMPQPCFDIEELRQRNAQAAGLNKGDG
jgi:hypothetical protein